MKLGLNTLLFTAGFDREHLPLLAKVKQWGYDGIEIARFAFDGFPAGEIGQAARDEGLEVTFCSALTGDTSLVSDDAATRQRALDFLKQGLDTACAIGSPVFLGPFCAPVGQLPGQAGRPPHFLPVRSTPASGADTRIPASLPPHPPG